MGPPCPQCKKSELSYRALLNIHPYPGEFSPAGVICPSCKTALRVTAKSRLMAITLILFLVAAPIVVLARSGVDIQEWQFFLLPAGFMIFYYLAVWPYVVRLKPWTAFQYWLPKSRLIGYSVYLLLPVATIALLLYLAAKFELGM